MTIIDNIKAYKKLVPGGLKNIIWMFIGSIGGYTSELLLPIASSYIILYVTEGSFKLAFLWSFIAIIFYIIYNLMTKIIVMLI